MSHFINTIKLAEISVNEILPITVELKDLPATDTNEVVNASRRSLSESPTETDPWTEILEKVTIEKNVLYLADLWRDDETVREKGLYRIQILARKADRTIVVETNLIINVLAG